MLTTVAAGRVFDFSHCLGMYSMGGLGFGTRWILPLAPTGSCMW